MPFTGTWATRAKQAPVGHGVLTAHPSHNGSGLAVEPGEEHWTAPPAPDYGDPGMDPWGIFVVDSPGDWTDQLPADEPGPGHEYDPGHDVDTGTRPWEDVSRTLELGERYTDDNHDSPDSIPELPTILRGINGRPENNPTEAPAPGRRFGRTWVDRARNRPDRVTDARVVYANLPQMGGDSSLDTVPEDPGPYSAPFSAWARGINGSQRMPMLRRTPTTSSESIVTDGLDDDYAADAQVDASWIVG